MASLYDFVDAYVSPSPDGDFVVRNDLVQAYTEWRQAPENDLPTMQLADLNEAERDSYNVLPTDDYKLDLLVKGTEGQRGHVADCWQGWSLSWPGGNKTSPKEEPPQQAPSPVYQATDRAVHACFHFNDGYDPSQLTAYIRNRVTDSSPDDLQSLEGLVESTVMDLSVQKSVAKWVMRTVEHETLKFNIFVRLQAADASAMQQECGASCCWP